MKNATAVFFIIGVFFESFVVRFFWKEVNIMINSHVRLANGIMRFARKLAYGLVARSRSMRIAADEDIKRKSPATHGETINELGHGDWEKGRDLRWSELNQQRLEKDISPTALMEFMLLGSGLEGLLLNVAQKVKAKLGIEKAKLEDQMKGVEKSEWELKTPEKQLLESLKCESIPACTTEELVSGVVSPCPKIISDDNCCWAVWVMK